MNKSTLKAEFINAKIKDAKYIGVSIKTEGSSRKSLSIRERISMQNLTATWRHTMTI